MATFGQLQPKRVWDTPVLTMYGHIEEVTQQTKNKTFGSGDDVILDGQITLYNVS